MALLSDTRILKSTGSEGDRMAMVHCRGCGKQIHETAPTCPQCGAPQAGVSSASLRTQTVAGLWCAFLGSFGAHRFYLRKFVTAVLYMVFFWTAIPALLACIDLLIIAFSDRNRWDLKYNNGIATPPVHWAVKVLAVVGPVMFAVGILAAIALPAYQDYIKRARVASEGIPLDQVDWSKAKRVAPGTTTQSTPKQPDLHDFQPAEQRPAATTFGPGMQAAIERYEFVLKNGTAKDQCYFAKSVAEIAAAGSDEVNHARWAAIAMADCQRATGKNSLTL